MVLFCVDLKSTLQSEAKACETTIMTFKCGTEN